MPEFSWRAADARGPGHRRPPGSRIAQRRPRGSCATAAWCRSASRETALSAPDALRQRRPPPDSWSRSPLPRRSNGPVTQAELLTLTSELSIMLRAGLALASALARADRHEPQAAGRERAPADPRRRQGRRAPQPGARPRAAGLFGDFYINMVRSGEASGQLRQRPAAPGGTHGAPSRAARKRGLRDHLPGDPAGGGGRVADRDAGLCRAAVREAVHRHGRRAAAGHPDRDACRRRSFATGVWSSASRWAWRAGGARRLVAFARRDGVVAVEDPAAFPCSGTAAQVPAELCSPARWAPCWATACPC